MELSCERPVGKERRRPAKPTPSDRTRVIEAETFEVTHLTDDHDGSWHIRAAHPEDDSH